MARVPMDKQWVVLKFINGRIEIVADYGDYAWGSPLYEVIGYYPTRRAAKQGIIDDRHLLDGVSKS